MKKEVLKKGKFLIAGLALLFLPGLIGCKAKKATDPAGAIALNDATYYVKLKATDLQSIFSYGTGNDVKELVFDFTQVKNNYSLDVSGYDNAGVSRTMSIPLEIISSKNPVKNTKKLKRRSQIITRGELKAFLGLATGTDTPIPSGKFVDMYFMASTDQDPRHPGQNLMYLFYSDNINTFKTTVAAGSGATKPSPPAPPSCETECDN